MPPKGKTGAKKPPAADKAAKTKPSSEPEKKPEKKPKKEQEAPPKEEEEQPKCRGKLNIPKKKEPEAAEAEEVEGEGDGDGELTSWALRGKMDCTYPDTTKIVRIFTSSTFTDTRSERNALMAQVYPKLRTFCRERGYDFQVVDMRWGVRDEATDDHMTSELCMRELTKCQKLSTGPAFITFLAQKYGYRPFPPKIDAEEFERLLEGVSEAEDKTLLTDWFVRDDNRSPPIYQLTSIRQKLPDYANEEDPEAKKKARDEWWAAFEKMQVILRQAATKQLEDELAIHKYYWSVTEEEIHNGIIAAENTNTTCYWFRRTLEDLVDHTEDKMARRFMDIVGDKVDEEAQELLNKLKDEKVPDKIPEDNITNYVIKWSENGVDIEKEEHKEYVETLCADFFLVLSTMIDQGIEARGKNEVTDGLTLEAMKHAQFAQQKCAIFHGRTEFLNQIKERLVDAEQSAPTVICGEPGAGKTSVMAKLVSLLPEWLEDEDLKIVVRFLGTSAASSNTRDLLKSICSQIHQMNGEDYRLEEVPQSLKELKDYFKQLVEELSGPLVLLLDSLDQLRDFGATLREWIPTELPEGVKLVLSCIPGEEFIVGPELQNHLAEECFINVPEFSEDDIREVVEESLKGDGRALQEEQMKLLLDACKDCALPLFVKLAYDSALLWRSNTPLEECSLGETVLVLIEQLFERIEKKYGTLLVGRSFGNLTIAKAGLSTNELEDILSLDDEVLNDVYQYHTPPLRRLPPLLWVRIQDEADAYLTTAGADGIQVVTWFHRQFRTVATERYVTEEAKEQLHQGIADYFLGKWADGKSKDYVDRKGNEGTSDRLVPAQPFVFSSGSQAGNMYNLRKMNELPYHLTMLEDKEGLKEHVFFNFQYLYQKISALSIESVFEDMDFAKHLSDPETGHLFRCLELSRDSLLADPKLLPSCLLGRLGSYDNEEHPYIHQLLDQAARPDFDCLYSSQGTMKLSGGPLIGKFVGHTAQIHGMDVTKDFTKLISTSGDNTLRVWDIESAREVQSIDMSPADEWLQGHIPNTLLCNQEKWVMCTSSFHNVVFFDLETGQVAKRIELENDEQPTAMDYMDEKNVMFFMQPSALSAWDIIEGKKEKDIKTPKCTELHEEMAGKPLDYVKALGDTLIYYKGGSGVVKFVRYDTDKKTDTYALYSKKDAAVRVCKFATLTDGYLVCYHYKAAPWEQKPVTAIVDVVDVNTAARIHSFRDVDAGYVMSIETVVAVGPSSFVLTTFPNGTTVLKSCDLAAKEKELKDAMTLTAVFPSKMVGVDKNRVILIYMTETTVMEFMNVNDGGGENEAGDTGSGLEEPEMYDIVACLPDTSRYVACIAAGSFALAIWDLYARCTVRIIDTSFVNSQASFPSKEMTMGVAYEAVKVCAINMVQGEVALQKAGLAMKPIDNQMYTGLAEDGSFVVVGPKANQLSGIDSATGKCSWSIDGGAGVTLGGLVVSDNGRVAVCETPLDPGHRPNQGKPKESKIHIFDLKGKKKLPDMKYTSVNPLRSTLVMQNNGALTPDGAYFVVTAYRDTVEILVHSTKDGKTRTIPSECTSQSLCYSERLKSVVLADAGKLELWTLKDMQKTDVDLGHTDSLLVNGVSKDGTYAIVMRAVTRNMIYIVDLVQQRLFAAYRADNEIAKSMFTLDNHFLLVATRTNPGLIQLCMYEAAKGCPALTDSQVADSDKEETGDKGAKKGTEKGAQDKGRKGSKAEKETAAKGRKDSKAAKEPPAKGRKGSKADDAATKDKGDPKQKDGKNRRDSKRQSTSEPAEQTDEPAKPDLGPTLEKQYMEELKDVEDIFGEAAQFNCKI